LTTVKNRTNKLFAVYVPFGTFSSYIILEAVPVEGESLVPVRLLQSSL